MASWLLAGGIITALAAPVPVDCFTADQVIAATEDELARVTVIRDRAELGRALTFMFENSDAAPPAADQLVVIEGYTGAQVVLIERGCATIKANSSIHLTARMLRFAKRLPDPALM